MRSGPSDDVARLKRERSDLNMRILKLYSHIKYEEGFKSHPPEEQERQKRQLQVMLDYSAILRDRISSARV